MDLPLVHAVTRECHQIKQLKHRHPSLIANGFVIGSLPQVLEWTDKDGNEIIRTIEDSELTDLLKAMLSPVRSYGYIFAYTGGSQKSIQGNFQFFELDHNRLGAVIAHLNQAGISEHIYVVLCGR
jgi:hypothetical protein